MFISSRSNSNFGRKIAQHFYFQTLFNVVLVIVFVTKIIHVRLTLISLLSLIIVGSLLYLSLPNYLQQVKNSFNK